MLLFNGSFYDIVLYITFKPRIKPKLKFLILKILSVLRKVLDVG